MKKETKIWKRAELVRCHNCSVLIDIRAELATERKKLVKEIEQIMRNTLSVDTPKYHREVDQMYKKLDKLK